jgi:D-aspartate ligase
VPSGPASAPLPPAILLGGNVTAVPVARSLGRARIPVYAVGPPGDPVGRSRYCHGHGAVPAGEDMQDRWLEWLLERAPKPGVVLPCSDDGIELVARHRAKLAEHGLRSIEGDDDVMLAMLDKERTYEIAHRAGVATPLTHTVRTRDDMGAALDPFPYPCGLKPVHAHEFVKRSGVKAKVMVLEDRAALEAALERLIDLDLEMQVTEIVQGGDDRLVGHFTYIGEDGEPLGHFTNRKLRQLPIHFGVGAYVTAEWAPDVAEEGMRFVRAAGLRGVAHTEFKRDERDGKLKLIECNHRFNLAIALLCRSGFDLPLLAYERALGRPGPSLDSPSYGLHLWHPVPDFRAFLDYRRAGELTTAGWLRSLAHRQAFSLWAADDPMPSVRDHLEGPTRLVRKLRRSDAAPT